MFQAKHFKIRIRNIFFLYSIRFHVVFVHQSLLYIEYFKTEFGTLSQLKTAILS